MFDIVVKEVGTSVRIQLIKSMRYNESVDMMYMAASGKVTKRRINVIRVGNGAFLDNCHLRGAKRTFRVDNVLAFVPVNTKESQVI